MFTNKTLHIFIIICIILLFNSSGSASNIIRHPSLSNSTFASGGHIYTGEDIANLFDDYNATGDLLSKYGIQKALFFKDDNNDMYVAAIHEATNIFMIAKVNKENMVKLLKAHSSRSDEFDDAMHVRLQKEDPAYALVFQPTANLARSKSSFGFADEVVYDSFPSLNQLYDKYSRKTE